MGLTAKITACIIVGVTIGLIGWDIYVASDGIAGDTISEIMLKVAKDHPIVPFALGVVIGHLFWPQG
jgi:hypothetical protein